MRQRKKNTVRAAGVSK